MNVKETRKYEMLLRVRDFGNTHQQLFSESTVAQQTFAAISAAIDELTTSNVTKMSAATLRRADGTRAARKALRELLQHVSTLARVFRASGLETARFELPKSRSDYALRMAGRQFAREARAFAAEFAGHGLAPSRIAQATTAFETAIRDRGNSKGKHTEVRTRIQVLLTKAHLNVQRLDILIANALDADPVIQAVWKQARRIEDRRRSRVAAADQQQPAADVVNFPTTVAV